MAGPNSDPIVSATTAAQLPPGAVVLHVEAGDRQSAEAAFAAGHVEGAVLLVRDEVVTRPMRPGDGRHPLPSAEDLADALGRLGVGWDAPVVAYDRQHGDNAAHVVHLLRLLGQDARLLDGGLAAFTDPVATGPGTTPTAVAREPRPWPADMLPDIDAVAAHAAAGGVLIDARAAERFRGETEPLDPIAGHIPGAVNAFYGDNLTPDGTFRDPEELRARFAALGAGPDAVVYCGSGVTACHDLLAIERAGLGRARLYVGSWSQWCRDASRPRATGPA
ncbi:sulfurtransferase [Pseudonocardia humida]|uniref:Sulfurtransferase n=1 Tax=Pseudonocardia humida TaxID=2800819 RepID=A0ABT0ZU28_9PSEU|nr:rhodanese-like domain-containing protein [Pseudonocardia humida]MCO1654235.1 sulfurtransferase [Pseudonocardia humida]